MLNGKFGMKNLFALFLLFMTFSIAGCDSVEVVGFFDPELIPEKRDFSSYSCKDPVFENERDGIYNYCPSVIELEDGTRYVYYCTNTEAFEVIDHVGCRKAVLSDCYYSYEDEQIVLMPTADTWDAQHTCDPSVIAGEFSYQGETYSYLMAYLGCVTTNNQENELGLAVAKSPEGPFIKVGTEPLIHFSKDDPDSPVFEWGVGQPSLVNMDKKGRVMIFYTRGDKDGTRIIAEEWDLSDLDSPIQMSSTKLSAAGLENLNGSTDYMNNADFAYDPVRNRFYAVSDTHPNPTTTPNFISSNFRVTYFEGTDFANVEWKTVEVPGEEETGFPRNHNCGLVRDMYGHLLSDYQLSVYYTMSEQNDDYLWTYRIYEYVMNIGE